MPFHLSVVMPLQASGATEKNKAKKEEEEMLREYEDELEATCNFTHNVDFQKAHGGLRIKKGHWLQFLREMKRNLPMTCPACVACRGVLANHTSQGQDAAAAAADNVASEDAQPDDVQPPPEPAVHALEARKRGRPKRGAESLSLSKWMETERAGIYHLVDESAKTWFCRLCNQELKLQRESTTFVALHEKRQLHKAKLELIRNGLEEPQTKEAPPLVPCSGVNIDKLDTAGKDLHGVRDSIKQWMNGGMPYVKSDKDDKPALLETISLSTTVDGVLLRHVNCKGEESVGPCHLCYSVSHNQNFLTEMRKWAWKLDCVQLGHLLLLGTPNEVRDHQELIQARDYFDKKIHATELEKIMKLDPADAVSRIRQFVISVPRNRRSNSLQELISCRLADFRDCSPRELEKNVFVTLVRNFQGALEEGTCHKEEFQLGAMVASGKLRNEPLVEALFKSVVAKICKQEKGCSERLASSKFFDEERAHELLITLGRGKATENLLQLLGFLEGREIGSLQNVTYNIRSYSITML